MKSNPIGIALLCAFAVTAISCFDLFDRPDGEAAVILTLPGYSDARSVIPSTGTQAQLAYEITCTSGGQAKVFSLGVGQTRAVLSLAPGTWDITAKAYLPVGFVHVATGQIQITLAAGENQSAGITLIFDNTSLDSVTLRYRGLTYTAVPAGGGVYDVRVFDDNSTNVTINVTKAVTDQAIINVSPLTVADLTTPLPFNPSSIGVTGPGQTGTVTWDVDAGPGHVESYTLNITFDPPILTPSVPSGFPSSDIIYSIACGGGRFVAGGQNSNAGYSVDGETWVSAVAVPAFATDNILAIAHGNPGGLGRFVIGGPGGHCAWSANGSAGSWTSVAVPGFTSSETINNIAYGNGYFVAVANNGKIAWSSDGSSWTASSNSTTVFGSSGLIDAVAYGDPGGTGCFIAADNFLGKIASSPDGDTWTLLTPTDVLGSSNDVYAIAYGGDRFIAVGDDGKTAWSSDGSTAWTVVDASSIFGSSIIYSIAYGGGRFAIAGTNGKIAWSTDGTVWIEGGASATFGSDPIRGIAYHDGRFVAVGASGKIGYVDLP
jgi:hypothetical protein